MLDQGFRVEAQVLRIGADHFQGFDTLGHASHVTVFDGLDVIGMDAGHLAGLIQRLAACFALVLQIPAGFAERIQGSVRLLADVLDCGRTLCGPDRRCCHAWCYSRLRVR